MPPVIACWKGLKYIHARRQRSKSSSRRVRVVSMVDLEPGHLVSIPAGGGHGALGQGTFPPSLVLVCLPRDLKPFPSYGNSAADDFKHILSTSRKSL